MKMTVYLLRENYTLFKLAVLLSGIGFLLSIFIMSVSKTWSLILLGVFFVILQYLLIYLGVDPYYKGIIYTLLPIFFTIVITLSLHQIPIVNSLFENIDVRRGVLTYPIGIILMVLTIKLFDVKPYIQILEERNNGK